MPLKHRRILDLNEESFGILDVASLFQGDFPGRLYKSFDHHVLMIENDLGFHYSKDPYTRSIHNKPLLIEMQSCHL